MGNGNDTSVIVRLPGTYQEEGTIPALLPLIADGATRISALSVSCVKMAYGHTSAVLSQSFITPRPTANLFGCSLPLIC